MPESFFSDLPDENEAKPVVSEEEKSDSKPSDKETEDIKNLEKANKRENARISALKADLAKKRQEAKTLKAKVEKPDVDDEEEEEEKEEEPVKQDIDQSVEAALKARDEKKYQDDLAAKIRQMKGIKRQEAEEIFKMTLSLPRTGDQNLDLKFGADRVQTLRESQRGFVTPSLGGAGFSDMRTSSTDELEGFSKERIEYLQRVNPALTKDEIKRLINGPDFARLYPKTIVNNR